MIVLGVAIMQAGYFRGRLDVNAWFALAAVTVAAFLYPLGNRAILLHLERTGEDLNAPQRVFGMTLASQPFWWKIAVYAGSVAGPPAPRQIVLAAGVALFAGTIATILFFQATGMVRNDPGRARRGRGDESGRAVHFDRARRRFPRRTRAALPRGRRRGAGRRRDRRHRLACRSRLGR